jgi:hypothetical protein
MAPPGLAGLVVREDREDVEDFEGLVALEGLVVLEPLGGIELSGVLEQPQRIRPTPARIPRSDRRRLRAMVELLFSTFTAFAS